MVGSSISKSTYWFKTIVKSQYRFYMHSKQARVVFGLARFIDDHAFTLEFGLLGKYSDITCYLVFSGFEQWKTKRIGPCFNYKFRFNFKGITATKGTFPNRNSKNLQQVQRNLLHREIVSNQQALLGNDGLCCSTEIDFGHECLCVCVCVCLCRYLYLCLCFCVGELNLCIYVCGTIDGDNRNNIWFCVCLCVCGFKLNRTHTIQPTRS